jgi:predicted dehydrogenase
LKDNVNVSVIGLGGIAQLVHLPALSKMKDVNIVAVSETNKSRLKTVANKFGIKNRFSNYNEMLEKVETDAVIIATPTNTHHQIALDAVDKVKNILVEKPVARTKEEASEIYKAVKKKNVNLMIGMNLRFKPDIMLVKSLLNSKDFGEPFYIKCSWIRNQSSVEKWFVKKNQSGGGVLSDLGIAILDLSSWLLDSPKIKTVSAQKFFNRTKSVEDSAVGLIRMEKDKVINFEVSWSLHAESQSMNLTAYGSEGTINLNPLKIYKRIDSTKIDYTPHKPKNSKELFSKSYENEIKHFVGAIKGNHPLYCKPEEIIYQMELLDALHKSSDNKSEINLS